jgi:hypothetical protein
VEEIFIDIQDLQALTTFFIIGLRMYQFYLLCVFCELFKCNIIAFTLHLRGVKGIIVKGIIVIL